MDLLGRGIPGLRSRQNPLACSQDARVSARVLPEPNSPPFLVFPRLLGTHLDYPLSWPFLWKVSRLGAGEYPPFLV